MRESVGETGGGVHLQQDIGQQDIGDPHLGPATIEVEHELIDVFRHCGGGPADPELAILDGAAGYPAVVRGIGEAIQALDQTRLALGQPLPGFERNRQPGRCVRCFDRRQGALYIAITPGVREPDVAGDTFRHCYWSALMTSHLGRAAAEEFGNRHEARTGLNSKGMARKEMDLQNNKIGRAIGEQATSIKDARIQCHDAARNNELQTQLGQR